MAIEGVPEEMLAVQVVEFNQPYKIHKVPTPTSLKPHEILLKTVVASLCHTDGMVVAGKFPTKLPCTASHEGTGIVVAVGDEVTEFKKGDRVMSGLPRNPCQQCFNCQGPKDWRQYCQKIEGYIGVFVDGAFSEYHIADARTSCHIPEKVSFANAAPLACAGCTIYRAISVADVPDGGWLGIVGAGGGLGHLGIQFAIAKGIYVVAIDARDEGLELCKKAGAQHIFDAREGKEKVVEKVQELTGGLGVHASINVSEHETSADMACAITRMHGTMVQTAQPDRVSVAFQELIFRDIRIRGTLIASQEDSQEMLDNAGKYGINVETNLFYGLEEVPKMVELAHSGTMKGKAVCVVDRAEFEKENERLGASHTA
ncbi:hypothetical protein AYL99_00727 [Fonsecaea erecta]|uniref:Enoyl reductase (ER) domain-containing protein n=1 Tax=Fonsecaea erecta TaxID=1367422 RepID=A0A179A0K2_9EURO|nr:hypothetical protein AYL99_00727 [Fonsecaea erecta]OAP64755.1 hypothetical protein AYL99_00727 [Fonsecaea erecta]